MRRLGIFVFYDKDGIVDRYILYLLQGMLKQINQLIIVCNGMVNPEGLRKLEEVSNQIYIRDNLGYDVAAFREALTHYVGWDKLAEYDEIVLWNDTFFGPIYPFKEMFDTMESEKLDFWGMTEGTIDCVPYPHIQSYFMVFAKSVFTNIEFQRYWEEMDTSSWSYMDVVLKHEVEFTHFLEKAGFIWDVYIHGEDYGNKIEKVYIKYLFTPYSLVYKERYPVVKRKAFVYPELMSAPYGELIKLMRFLKDSGLYDVDMILENIIRIYNLQTLSDVMRWKYCLKENNIGEITSTICRNILILLIIENDRWIDDIVTCIPDGINVNIIALNNMEKKVKEACNRKMLKYYKVISLQSGSSIIARIIQLIDTNTPEYVCIIHNVIIESKINDFFLEKSKLLCRLNNLMGDIEKINSIIKLFKENSRLAFLIPPPFYYGQDFSKLGNNWGQSYDDVKYNLKKVGNEVSLTKDINCVSDDFSFWGRVEVTLYTLSVLEKLEIQDNNWLLFGKIFPYIAQGRGFYTAVVCNEEYEYYDSYPATYSLRYLMRMLGGIFGVKDIESIRLFGVIKYAVHFNEIYIYGAGTVGKRVLLLLKSNGILAKAFLVSDIRGCANSLDGIPVIQYDQSKISADACIIVAMRKQLQTEIYGKIENSNCKNIYWT